MEHSRRDLCSYCHLPQSIATLLPANLTEYQLQYHWAILRVSPHQARHNSAVTVAVDKTQHTVSSNLEVLWGLEPLCCSGYIRSALLPVKSLWNLCATLLPHDRNNWTGIAVSQPHTTQLSQLTPAAGPAVGLRERHGVGAVLDSSDGKKVGGRTQRARKERVHVVTGHWCDRLGRCSSFHCLIFALAGTCGVVKHASWT